MVIESINWMAGGPQGSGVDSASTIFGRACGYGGLYVFGRREYHSNIKTMHSYFHQRVSKQPTLSNISDIDLLAAFDAETIVRHVGDVVNEGGIRYGSIISLGFDESAQLDAKFVQMPVDCMVRPVKGVKVITG